MLQDAGCQYVWSLQAKAPEYHFSSSELNIFLNLTWTLLINAYNLLIGNLLNWNSVDKK